MDIANDIYNRQKQLKELFDSLMENREKIIIPSIKEEIVEKMHILDTITFAFLDTLKTYHIEPENYMNAPKQIKESKRYKEYTENIEQLILKALTTEKKH